MAGCIQDGTVDDGAVVEPESNAPNEEETETPEPGGEEEGATPGLPLDFEPIGDVDTCSVDLLSEPSVYVRRVKNLMTGAAPEDSELQSVMDDPAALRGLVSEWFDDPAFRAKLQEFLTKSLQQAEGARQTFGLQAVGNPNIGGWDAPPALFRNLTESFARTVMVLIEEGRPFNEIATTRRWMMTTGMVSYLLAAENDSPQMRFYHEPFTDNGVTFDEDTPFRVQFNNHTYYSSAPIPGCGDPYSGNAARNERNTYRLFMRGSANNICNNQIRMSVFQDRDFEDWRMVDMVPLEDGDDQPSMFDAPSLRNVTELPLRSTRTGYFSTPAFLAGWPSNVDNSFRVTTNQMLIAGLGLAFEDSDVSTPLGDDGLAEDHAAPNTQCFACHKNLDPMRNFFANEYDADSYAVVQTT
ncbi:MAG: hypothetical protein AAFX94_15795, partial [Myxococcota bacterium]